MVQALQFLNQKSSFLWILIVGVAFVCRPLLMAPSTSKHDGALDDVQVFFFFRNSVSIKPLIFEHLQSIKTDLHVGFTEVLGAWNFTLQADTPLYWLRCGRLDKCPRGTLTPRVLDMIWDTQKCDFLRLMDKLLQTLRCEYLMILQGLNTGFCPWKHQTAWTFA